jgi:hypothetical protein
VGLAAFALAPAVRGDDDFKGVIGTTGKDSKPYSLPPVRPKQGSPNVVYLLLDDVGRDSLSPVSSGYAGKGEFAFTPGALEKVVIKVERQSPAVPRSQASNTR